MEINETGDKDWDRRLLSGKTESLYLYHSTYWAARLIELLHYKPMFFSVYNANQLCLVLLGFIVPVEKVSCIVDGRIKMKQMIRKVIVSLRRRKSFIWYGQPVGYETADENAYRFLAHSLSDYINKGNLRLIHGEWPKSKKDALPSCWKVEAGETLKVDVTRDLDEIYKSFKSSARKEIKKAERSGVIVKRIDNIDELKKYYIFAAVCAKRYNKNVNKKDYLLSWELLRKKGFYFETFMALHNDNFLSGLTLWGSKACIQEIGSFQSEYSYINKLSGPDLIKWEVIKWAKTEGIEVYDLAGINPSPGSEKEINIKRFKEKWGGQLTEYLIVQD